MYALKDSGRLQTHTLHEHQYHNKLAHCPCNTIIISSQHFTDLFPYIYLLSFSALLRAANNLSSCPVGQNMQISVVPTKIPFVLSMCNVHTLSTKYYLQTIEANFTCPNWNTKVPFPLAQKQNLLAPGNWI